MKRLILILGLWVFGCLGISPAQVRVPGVLTNGGNAYPVVPFGMVSGSPQIVATMTALSNQPSWLRATGQVTHVLSDGTDWRYVGGTNNDNLIQVVVAAGSWTGSAGGSNYVAKFGGSSNILNSAIVESNGNVGIGTNNPRAVLDLAGQGTGTPSPLKIRTPGYLTMIDPGTAGIFTAGFLSINPGGQDLVNDTFSASISGYSSYMLGIASDIGLNPTVVVRGGSGEIYTGLAANGGKVFFVDNDGSAKFGVSSVATVWIGSNVATQAELKLGSGDIYSFYGGEPYARFLLNNDGSLSFGPGSSELITKIYDWFGRLRTDNNLYAGGKFAVGYDPTSVTTGVAAFSGNVGIGTVTPGATLDVIGTAIATNFVTKAGGQFIGSGSGLTNVPNAMSNVTDSGYAALVRSNLMVSGGGTGLPGLTVGGNVLVVTNGNVGIGTSAPNARLDIVYNALIPLKIRGSPGHLTTFDPGTAGMKLNGFITINGGGYVNDDIPVSIAGYTSYMMGVHSDIGTNPTVLAQGGAGEIYTGLAANGTKVFWVNNDGSAQFGVGSAAIVRVGSNVTGNSEIKLVNGQITSSFGAEAYPRFLLSNVANSSSGGLMFGAGSGTPVTGLYSWFGRLRTDNGFYANGNVGIGVDPTGAKSLQVGSVFAVDSAGKVGIGTVAPAGRLDIVANGVTPLRIFNTVSNMVSYFDEPSAALRLGSYLTINPNGLNLTTREITNSIAGHTAYMIGVESSIGTNPTVIVKGGGGEIYTGYSDANSKVFSVANDGSAALSGVVNATNGFGIAAAAINSWDDVTNYFTLPVGGSGTNRYYEAGEAFHWVELGGTNGDPYAIKGSVASATVPDWTITYSGNVESIANFIADGSVTLSGVFGGGLSMPFASAAVMGSVSDLTAGQSIRVDAAGTGFEAYSTLTNTAQFDTDNADIVLGTAYTNSARRLQVFGSFQLNAAAAGTAKVTVYSILGTTTNKLTISAGPLASLSTIEPLTMRVQPGGYYYYTDETSGVGATATFVAGTHSRFWE